MRDSIIATTAVLLATPTAIAQAETPQPPALDAAPAASAPFEQRETWCELYTTWLVEGTPDGESAQPADVRPTHRYEVEFNSCKIDPQQYRAETRAEADVVLNTEQS